MTALPQLLFILRFSVLGRLRSIDHIEYLHEWSRLCCQLGFAGFDELLRAHGSGCQATDRFCVLLPVDSKRKTQSMVSPLPPAVAIVNHHSRDQTWSIWGEAIGPTADAHRLSLSRSRSFSLLAPPLSSRVLPACLGLWPLASPSPCVQL